MSKRIKDTYQKHLWIFVAANIAVFWILLFKRFIDLSTLNQEFKIFVDPKSILFVMSPILSLILNGILSNKIKEFLVFWRLNNPLPGCRAFSYFVDHDYRINVENLVKRIGKFPVDPNEQNRKWYSLYKEYDKDEVISGSHRDFLLTRDLCSISFVLLIFLCPVSIVVFSSDFIRIVYCIFLVIQFVILSVTAKNYGNRFVCNVLAIASAK